MKPATKSEIIRMHLERFTAPEISIATGVAEWRIKHAIKIHLFNMARYQNTLASMNLN